MAIGGRGSLIGPIVGALIVGGARSVLSENFPATWQYFYGVLFIGAVLLFPDGIVGLVRRLAAQLRSGAPASTLAAAGTRHAIEGGAPRAE